MTDLMELSPSGMHDEAARVLRAAWKPLALQGLVITAIGCTAIAMPRVATFAVEVLAGGLLIGSGLVRLSFVRQLRGTSATWFSALSGLLGIVLGYLLLAQPLDGLVPLAFFLLFYFVYEAAIAFAIAIDLSHHFKGWVWSLWFGLVDVALALTAWHGWSESVAWAVGLVMGLNLIAGGVASLMTGLAAKIARPLVATDVSHVTLHNRHSV